MCCYLCEKEITAQNSTREHIIPGALGSNLYSETILCLKCNNELASQIDAAFIESYSYLYGLLQEARSDTNRRNKLTGTTKSGETINFTAGMVPHANVTIKLNDDFTLQFSCPVDEAEVKVLKRLRELKGKFPQLDPEKAMSKMQWVKNPIGELVYFSNYTSEQSKIGGPKYFRGIKKIALNFYLSKGYDSKYVRGVINQVKHGIPANEVISTFYYPSIRPVHELGEQEVSHIIKLVGNPHMGVLYCYVELFNCNHSLILLNNHYDGPALDEQLCYDTLTSTYPQKVIALPFKHREHVIDCFKLNDSTNPAGQAAYNRTRRILEDCIRQKGYIK